MSRFIRLCGVLAAFFAFAAAAPVAQAQSSPVRAVVRFASGVSAGHKVAAIEGAGGQVLRLRRGGAVARMSASAADTLRSAMGVVSVRIRR